MGAVQQNNRNQVGLTNTNKQIGNLGSSSVYLDAGMSMSAFLGGIAVGLTKTYDKRMKFERRTSFGWSRHLGWCVLLRETRCHCLDHWSCWNCRFDCWCKPVQSKDGTRVRA